MRATQLHHLFYILMSLILLFKEFIILGHQESNLFKAYQITKNKQKNCMQCQTYVTFFPWLGNSNNFCISLKKICYFTFVCFLRYDKFFFMLIFSNICFYSTLKKIYERGMKTSSTGKEKNRDAREVTNQTDNNHIGTTKRKTSRKLWKLSNKNKKKKIL